MALKPPLSPQAQHITENGRPSKEFYNWTKSLSDEVTALSRGAGASGRTILAADLDLYVTVTGSDSNDGSIGSPWATLQHAYDYISGNLDMAGFTATINGGAGTFVGVIIHSTVGGGIIQFNGAGPGTTIVQDSGDGNGSFSFLLASATQFGIDLCTINPVSSYAGIYIGANVLILLGQAPSFVGSNLAFDAAGGRRGIFSTIPAAMFVTLGSFAITGSWVNFYELQGGAAVQDFGTWTLTGTPTFSGVFAYVDAAQVLPIGASYTGAATGSRFKVFDNGIIIVSGGDSAGTFYPGDAIGSILSGGQYAGITDFVGVVASLPTANIQGARAFVTDALTATFGSAPTGTHSAFVPVYNNGTQWLMG